MLQKTQKCVRRSGIEPEPAAHEILWKAAILHFYQQLYQKLRTVGFLFT